MQFIDLGAQQSRIRDNIESNIKKVLNHGKYIMGPEVTELEERLCAFVNAKHCVSCSSGTDALLMSLMALDIGPGDAVFTSPFTFIATAEVIALLGATPVFVDIDPQTFNLDPDHLKKAVEAITAGDPNIYPLPRNETKAALTPRAVIPVDLFGLPADYQRINQIASDHKLWVVEDAAQSLGGEYNGRKAGNLAHMGCVSFFPAKPLGSYGDGGALFTDNDELADKLKSIRVHGKGTHKYDNARVGLNGRLDTLQAAVLLAKLDIFAEEIEKRRNAANIYTGLLKGRSRLDLPFIPRGYQSAWAQYSLLAEDTRQRQIYQDRLKSREIPSVVYYPCPLHLQGTFNYLEYQQGDMPVSEDCSKRIFSLPMHPYLSTEDQNKICDCLI